MKIHGVVWAAAGGVLGGVAVWVAQTSSLTLVPGEWSYEALAATLLTAASLLVTMIGVGVGVLALWGYSQFKNMTSEAAQKAALVKIEAELKEGELRSHVESVVRSVLEDVIFDRPGPLLQYLEERAAEQRRLREVDAEWQNVNGNDADA